MRIRNLNDYVRDIIQAELPKDLWSANNPFFQKFKGEDDDLENFIGTISSFAVDSTRQFVFEFLQNADDAGADSFFILFNDEYLLIVNNGLPLKSDRSDQSGELFSLLGKEKGKKRKEKNKKGEFGIGSKLLYDLLLDRVFSENDTPLIKREALVQRILHENRGPIIFSWKRWGDIEHLFKGSTRSFELDTYTNNELPLLSKFINTYYPSLPGESGEKANGESLILFPEEELNDFITFFNKFFKSEWIHHLKNDESKGGMMTFIPLGKGQSDYLNDVSLPKVIPGISASLALLDTVKHVWINDVKVQKNRFHQVKLFTEGAIKESFETVYLDNPFEVTGELVNFHKFFPVTEEIHGFKFFIHSKNYELDNSRQRIDEGNPFNQRLLKAIGESVCKYLEELVKSPALRDEYLTLFKCILASDEAKIQKGLFRDKLYAPLLSTVRQNLPTRQGFEGNHENVIIRDFSIDVDPADLGLDSISWLEPALEEYYDQAEFKLGLKRWSLSDFLQDRHDTDAFHSWLMHLDESAIRNLFSDISEEYSENISSFKSLKVFLGSDGLLYCYRYILAQSNVFISTPKIRKIARVLKKLGVVICGEKLDWSSELEQTISNDFESDQLELFEKISAVIDPSRLSHEEKWILFKNFIEHFDSEELKEAIRNNLILFSNQSGTPLPLSSLINNHLEFASSGLLEYYQIKPLEKFFDYQIPYFMREEEIRGQLKSDWDEKILPKLEEKLSGTLSAKIVYQDFSKIYGFVAGLDKRINGGKVVVNENGKFVKEEDLFWNKNLENIEGDIFQKIRSLIKRLTSFSCFHSVEQYFDFQESPFVLSLKGYFEIKDRLTQNEAILDFSEVKLLPYLASSASDHFFSRFVLSKHDDHQYELRSRQHSQYQYYSDDAALNNFLSDKADKWVLLPRELLGIFPNDQELRQVNEQFLLGLIRSYPGQRVFIRQVVRQSENVCRQYLDGFSRIDLDSEHLDYQQDSFEFLLLRMITEKGLDTLVKGKIFVDNKPLNQVNVRDVILVPIDGNFISFSLAELLPSQYRGVSDSFQRVVSLFEDLGINNCPLFNTREVSVGEVKSNLLNGGVRSALHVSFLAAYKLSEVGAEDRFFGNISQYVPEELSSTEILESFFKKEIFNFSKCYHFQDFSPGEKIIFPDQSILFESEVIPTWVEQWIRTSEGYSKEKERFLRRAGVRKDPDPVIELRRALLKNEDIVEEVIEEVKKNAYFFGNTLKWASFRLGSFPRSSARAQILSGMAAFAIEAEEEFSLSYLKIVSVNGETDFDCQLKFWEKDQPCFYFESSTFLPRLFEGVRGHGGSLAFLNKKFFTPDSIEWLEKNYGFEKAWVNRELIEEELGTVEEWNASYYRQWIQNEGKGFSVKLLRRAIPFKYILRTREESFPIGEHRDGDVGIHKVDDGISEILVNKEKAQRSSVLEILEENQAELFSGKKEVLIALFRYAVPKKHEQELVEYIQQIQLTRERIEELIKAEHKNKDEKGGNITLDKEVTKEQQDILNKFVNQLDEEKWRAFNQHLDQILVALDHLEEEADPDSVIGYIGEQLVKQWLLFKNPGAEVDHVAETRNQREFDILLKLPSGKEFEIDVKTTIKSVVNADAPLPFYIKRSQYTYVKEQGKDNYYISRISLEDLGLNNLPKRFSVLEGNREAIAFAVQEFFLADGAKELFHKMQMTFRVSYDRYVAEFM